MQFLAINRREILHCFSSIFFANAPYWIFGNFIFLNRSLINYDTLVALLVMVISRPIGAILLILSWATDGLVSQSLTYQFLSPVDFLESARFSGTINLFDLVSAWHFLAFFVFIMSLYLCIIFTRKASSVVGSICYFLIAGLILVTLDSANGASDLWRRDKMIIPINIGGSPQYTLAKGLTLSPEQRGVRKISDDQSISKNFDIFKWAENHPDRSIFFVVVESLGVPNSKDALKWLDQNLQSEHYTSVAHHISFKGATTSGELRSLCALEGSYTSINSSNGENCLPSQLSKIGWTTSGFHGFSGKMFDRHLWWPNIGFSKAIFVEDSKIENLPRCGNGFRGACDSAIIKVAADSLVHDKTFAYVLTLNTHLPVVARPVSTKLSEICGRDSIPSGACTHIESLGDVLTQVIHQSSTLAKPPLVIVVGDHAPPFVALDDRRSFRQDVVPAYVLEPNAH
jgi:hypothetical protein